MQWRGTEGGMHTLEVMGPGGLFISAWARDDSEHAREKTGKHPTRPMRMLGAWMDAPPTMLLMEGIGSLPLEMGAMAEAKDPRRALGRPCRQFKIATQVEWPDPIPPDRNNAMLGFRRLSCRLRLCIQAG